MSTIQGPDGTEVDREQFVAAVNSVRPMVRSMLSTTGWSSGTEDVMAAVLSDLWESIPRWVRAGRPALGSWANGVAKNAVRMWLRKDQPGLAPGGQPAVRLDALPVDLPHPQDRSESESDVAQAAINIVDAIRARVLARPGGAARWTRLVQEVARPTQGARARAELLGEIAQLRPPSTEREEAS